MKIKKSQLKQIIQEELEAVLGEDQKVIRDEDDNTLDPADTRPDLDIQMDAILADLEAGQKSRAAGWEVQEDPDPVPVRTQKKVLTPSYIGPPPPRPDYPAQPDMWAPEEEVTKYLSNPGVPNFEKRLYVRADSGNYPPGGQDWMIANYPDDIESIAWKADREAAAAAERAKHAKKVNESQDKLYQMVQEELEAVLDEKYDPTNRYHRAAKEALAAAGTGAARAQSRAHKGDEPASGGTWDPVQAKEKRHKARHGIPDYGPGTGDITQHWIDPEGKEVAATTTPRQATRSATMPTRYFGDPERAPPSLSQPSAAADRATAAALMQGYTTQEDPLRPDPYDVRRIHMDIVAPTAMDDPVSAPPPDTGDADLEDRIMRKVGDNIARNRRRRVYKEGLMKQMVQEELEAVLAERNR